jgi:deoxyadenosine/deoxycytidine kinase
MIIVNIEGNIGSGKTTLLNKLKKENSNLNFYFIDEPIDEWLNYKIDDKNILQCFYDNPKKYSFEFQKIILKTTFENTFKILKNTKNDLIIITERSIHSSINIFSEYLFDIDYLTINEFEELKQIYKGYYKNLPKTNIIIFVDEPTNVCYKRIQERNRDEESKITINYLDCIDKNHKLYIEKNIDKTIINPSVNEILELLNNLQKTQHQTSHQ